MKQVFALILASGAFGLAADAEAGTPRLAAHPFAFEGANAGLPHPLLVDDDDGDDEDRDHDDDDDDDHDPAGRSQDDDDEEEDDCSLKDPACVAGDAAPAGRVAPPKNGLFTDGTAPVVTSN